MRGAARWVVTVGLSGLMVFTPLAFGAVHVWAYSLMQMALFAMFALYMLVEAALPDPGGAHRGPWPAYAAGAAFLCYAGFQMLPLEPGLLGRLSPRALDLYARAIPGYMAVEGTEGAARSLSLLRQGTLEQGLLIGSYMCAFGLAVWVGSDRRMSLWVVMAVALTGTLEAIYGLYSYFSGSTEILGYERLYGLGAASGTFVNKNHFAGYLSMALCLVLGYVWGMMGDASTQRGPGGIRRMVEAMGSPRAPMIVFLLSAAVSMALGVVFSMSRMAVGSLIVTLGLMIVLTGLREGGGRALAGAGFLGGAALAAYAIGLSPLLARYEGAMDVPLASRVQLWRETWAMIRDFPLTGVGLGAFEPVFSAYRDMTRYERFVSVEFAHNDYLHMLAEVGVAGCVPIALGVLYVAWLTLRACMAGPSPQGRGLALGSLAAMAYLGLHSIADFNLHIQSNALLIFVAAGLGVGAGRWGLKMPERGRRA